MTIVDLTNKENELLDKVENVVGLMAEQNVILKQKGVFDDYNKIFNEYVNLHKKDLEALKRCLFLYWYSASEPSCFTGLGEFDNEEIEKVLNTLDRRLSQGITDYELEWMLGYYSNWNYIFEPFSEFKFILEKINKKNRKEMPDEIDRIEMGKRGQMGKYWNSLTRFEEKSL